MKISAIGKKRTRVIETDGAIVQDESEAYAQYANQRS
jgi:hypothetical protein